nr:hypothetical protein [Thauera humireducens]
MGFNQRLTEPSHDAGDQGVAHQKRTAGRLDPGDVGEATGKPVERFQFFRRQAAQATITVLDDVRGARGARPTFAGDDRARRTVERVREGHRALAKGVGVAIGAHALNGLRPLQRLPTRQGFIGEKEGRWHVRRVTHDVAQRQRCRLANKRGVVTDFGDFKCGGPNLTAHTDTATGEAAAALVSGVLLLSGEGVGWQLEVAQSLTGLELRWQRLGHRSVPGHPARGIGADRSREPGVQRGALMVSLDKNAAAFLRIAVVGGIDHAPFDRIAELLQARQNDGEIPPLAARRAGNQPVHVLQHHVLHRPSCADPEFEQTVDAPPQHALLAGEPLRAGQGLCNGIVLARKAPDQHLGVKRINAGQGRVILQHLEKVLVHQVLAAPAGAIHLGRPLFLHRRFKLVGPHHLEAGLLSIFGSGQSHSEPTHPRKKLQGAQRAHWARGLLRLMHRRLREARRRRE